MREPRHPNTLRLHRCNGCGFYYNHSVNLYSSPDLVTWTAHGNVLPLGGSRPNAVLFSPKVLYNARTQTYVLWLNFVYGMRRRALLRVAPAHAPPRAPPQAAVQLRRRDVQVPLRPLLCRVDDRRPHDAVRRPLQQLERRGLLALRRRRRRGLHPLLGERALPGSRGVGGWGRASFSSRGCLRD